MNRLNGKTILLSLLTLLLVACGKDDGDRDSTASGLYLDESEALARAERDAARLLGPLGENYRAAWDQVKGSAAWNQTVLQEFKSRRSAFEAARDLEEFCPGYGAASAYQRETCWLRIVSAMAKFESDFRPSATYTEHTGRVSVGLLMMDPDHCPKAGSIALLKNAVSNIRCAMARMSLLIARDRYVSGPDHERGAAAYWSVLRPPYRFQSLLLGRKNQILAFTRSYRAFEAIPKKGTYNLLAGQTSP